MFSRILSDSLRISLSIPQYAEELFELTDRNRQYLRQWLPWLDDMRAEEDTKKFLALQLLRFARGESLHTTIFSKGAIAGVAGFNSIDRTNGIGSIGYWLGEEFTGQGIMTAVVRDLVEIGRAIIPCKRLRFGVPPATREAGPFRKDSDSPTKAPFAVRNAFTTNGLITKSTPC